jgi:hypothetical protein
MIFFEFFFSNILGGEEEWGGQMGVASWGWLQSPFLIVCLNQSHFFLSLLSTISIISFRICFTKYHGERAREWGEGLYKNNKITKIEFT